MVLNKLQEAGAVEKLGELGVKKLVPRINFAD